MSISVRECVQSCATACVWSNKCQVPCLIASKVTTMVALTSHRCTEEPGSGETNCTLRWFKAQASLTAPLLLSTILCTPTQIASRLRVLMCHIICLCTLCVKRRGASACSVSVPLRVLASRAFRPVSAALHVMCHEQRQPSQWR